MQAYLAHLQRNDDFVHLVARIHAQLEALYGDTRNEAGKVKATKRNKDVPPEQLRQQKERILEAMKLEYADLKKKWLGEIEYDGWFAHPINNAHLNSVAAYYDFVPAFQQLLAANGGDLEKFYDAVERLSKAPKKERHATLRALAGESTAVGGG